jgi:hypothetical protein
MVLLVTFAGTIAPRVFPGSRALSTFLQFLRSIIDYCDAINNQDFYFLFQASAR